MKSFRNLNVYINAKELVRRVYELLKKFPKEEQYALCDQLRRAVVSIPSNIAEGCGREVVWQVGASKCSFRRIVMVLCAFFIYRKYSKSTIF